MSTLYYESSIAHHGVKGQRWGVRRYQNPDGSLNAAGKRHVAEWKENQLSKVYPKYNAELHSSVVNKNREKYEEQFKKPITSEKDLKKLSKAEERLTKSEVQMYVDEGYRMLEDKKIRSMTMDDIKKENSYVAKRTAASVAIDLGSIGASMALGLPIAFVEFASVDDFRSEHRVKKSDRERIKKEATERANKNHMDRLNRITYVRG